MGGRVNLKFVRHWISKVKKNLKNAYFEIELFSLLRIIYDHNVIFLLDFYFLLTNYRTLNAKHRLDEKNNNFIFIIRYLTIYRRYR